MDLKFCKRGRGPEPGTFRVLGERDNHYTTETPDGMHYSSNAILNHSIKKILSTSKIGIHWLVGPFQDTSTYRPGLGLIQPYTWYYGMVGQLVLHF